MFSSPATDASRGIALRRQKADSSKGVFIAESCDRLGGIIEPNIKTSLSGNSPDRLQLLVELEGAMISGDEMAPEHPLDVHLQNSYGEYIVAVNFNENVLVRIHR